MKYYRYCENCGKSTKMNVVFSGDGETYLTSKDYRVCEFCFTITTLHDLKCKYCGEITV